jgi:homoserine dehydrogenase
MTAHAAAREAFDVHARATVATFPRATRGAMDLMLLGCGRVGRAVAQLVLARAEHLETRYEISPRWVAIGDSSGYLVDPRGLDADQVVDACRAKVAGRPLASLPGAALGCGAAMVDAALTVGLERPVLVDASDADAAASSAYRRAIAAGCDVVTANKKPFAAADFETLRASAGRHGCRLRGEATVGAGLPVLDTLEQLVASGDVVHRIEGCFSGTIGFVLAGLESGCALGDVVADAVARGIAEPDPVADLCGDDVGRKALILGRLAGLLDEAAQVEVEPLIDGSLAGASRDALARALASRDVALRWRIEAARCEGRRLRYVATIERGRARVGLVEVPSTSRLGVLDATDNLVAFHTDRYSPRPLVVAGPGAGVEVTAAGVFADLLRVAAERR